MDEDDFSFDFEKVLEEKQRRAASAPSSSQIPASAAVPVNQSEGSFKRNFRQVTYLEACLPFKEDHLASV